MRERTIGDEAAPLRRALADWAAKHRAALRGLDDDRFEDFFDQLSDRAADIWEPLLGIADLAGDEVLAQARQAAVALCGRNQGQEESVGVRLLGDIRSVFPEHATDNKLPSMTLVDALAEKEESPWAEWRAGSPLTQAQLARLLAPHGIRPRTIRLPNGQTPKGYHLDQFADAFARYLPALEDSAATTPQPAANRGSSRGGSLMEALGWRRRTTRIP